MRECILIRSRSLLSSLRKFLSRAEMPDFRRRKGCAPAWLVVDEQLSLRLGRGCSVGGSCAMADRSTALRSPRSPGSPIAMLRSLPELSDPSAIKGVAFGTKHTRRHRHVKEVE